MMTVEAIARRLLILLACGLLGACAAMPGASVASTAPAAATTTPATPAPSSPSPSSPGSSLPSATATSPASSVIPLLVCDHPPCALDAGTYQTSGPAAFLIGLRVTVPTGWYSNEQDAGEFDLVPVDHPDATVFFWRGISATANDLAGTPLADVDGTPAALVSSLTSNPNLIVTAPRQAMIARLPVVTIDIQVSPTAQSVGSDCPVKPCVGFLRDAKHWEGPFSLFQGEILRLYLGTIGPADDPHTFVVAIDAPGMPPQQVAMDAFTERVRPILDSVVIPDVIVDN